MPATSPSSLTSQQISDYQRDGYLVLRSLLSARHVSSLQSAADDVARQVGPLLSGNPRVQIEPDRGEGPRIRLAEPALDISPAIAAFARSGPLPALFRDLFEGEEPVLFEDKVNYKYPRGGTQFPMHQDYSYWTSYSPRLASALIYLDDASEENGCLEMVPGRHRDGLLARTSLDVGAAVDHHIPPETLDPKLAVKAPGAAGTVLLFSCLTPHRSAANLSDRPRRALILTYNPASDGNTYAERYAQTIKRWREWMAEL